MERRAPDVIAQGLAFMERAHLIRAYIRRANILQKTLHVMGRALNIMRRAPDVTTRRLDFMKRADLVSAHVSRAEIVRAHVVEDY